MSVPFVFSERNGREEIVVFFDGQQKTVTDSDSRYKALKDAVKRGADESEIKDILVVRQVAAAAVDTMPVWSGTIPHDNNDASELVFRSGKLYLRDTEVDESLAKEIATLVVNGMPRNGMVNFIYRLYDSVRTPNGKRVSARVRSELLGFVKRNGIVVDSNGDIISYKAVKENYYDKHTGKTFKNTPGTRVWMDFGDVDDNMNVGCSKGLHCGSLDYVAGFGWGNDRIVVVRVDPADVVSVPSDCSHQKLRCCAYTVIGDYEGELKQRVYEATDNVDDMYDDDYDRYGYDYDEDDEDDDWDSVDGLDDWDDDVYLDGDVQTEQVSVQPPSIYGVKPSGHKYYNHRGPDGKFSSN